MEGRQKKKKYKSRGGNVRKAKTTIGNNLLLGEAEKAELCQRADDQHKVSDLQENEFQTDNDKSKKLTAELSSINDKVSNKEGTARVVWKREQGT